MFILTLKLNNNKRETFLLGNKQVLIKWILIKVSDKLGNSENNWKV